MVARNAGMSPHGWVACVLAALLEERDIMRGRAAELPADLALRAKAVLGLSGHDAADRGAVRRVLDAARDIARRSRIDNDPGIDDDMVDALAGQVLLAAYPDRLAMSRGTPGQFLMRGGGGVSTDKKDALAREGFIVAADLDGGRGSARLRRGAAVDAAHIAPVLGDDVTLETDLMWDKSRDDLVLRVVRKVGSLRIDERDLEPSAGPETTAALVARVADTSMGVLGGAEKAESLRVRAEFARRHLGGDWPDLSRRTMLATLDEWLVPFLAGATGRADLRRVDLVMAMQSMLGWDKSAALDRIAPVMYEPPRGRPVAINYADPDVPTVSVRVQHLFGVTVHPTVLDGRVPLRVQLLSPADRPIQVTADLPGFWGGSWADVRKDMAGRYPKHDWPANPNA
jgi:ATP-dependent helicase HrpB